MLGRTPRTRRRAHADVVQSERPRGPGLAPVLPLGVHDVTIKLRAPREEGYEGSPQSFKIARWMSLLFTRWLPRMARLLHGNVE